MCDKCEYITQDASKGYVQGGLLTERPLHLCHSKIELGNIWPKCWEILGERDMLLSTYYVWSKVHFMPIALHILYCPIIVSRLLTAESFVEYIR